MAIKFNFRLNPVLKLRSHDVDKAKQQLSIAARDRSDKEDIIVVKQQYYNEFVGDSVKSSKVNSMQTKFYHKVFLQDEIKKLEKEKIRLTEIEELKKDHLSQAMKKEKILEKLKEKRESIHNEKVLKEEVKTLDEIAIKRHNKQAVESAISQPD